MSPLFKVARIFTQALMYRNVCFLLLLIALLLAGNHGCDETPASNESTSIHDSDTQAVVEIDPSDGLSKAEKIALLDEISVKDEAAKEPKPALPPIAVAEYYSSDLVVQVANVNFTEQGSMLFDLYIETSKVKPDTLVFRLMLSTSQHPADARNWYDYSVNHNDFKQVGNKHLLYLRFKDWQFVTRAHDMKNKTIRLPESIWLQVKLDDREELLLPLYRSADYDQGFDVINTAPDQHIRLDKPIYPQASANRDKYEYVGQYYKSETVKFEDLSISNKPLSITKQKVVGKDGIQVFSDLAASMIVGTIRKANHQDFKLIEQQSTSEKEKKYAKRLDRGEYFWEVKEQKAIPIRLSIKTESTLGQAIQNGKPTTLYFAFLKPAYPRYGVDYRYPQSPVFRVSGRKPNQFTKSDDQLILDTVLLIPSPYELRYYRSNAVETPDANIYSLSAICEIGNEKFQVAGPSIRIIDRFD